MAERTGRSAWNDKQIIEDWASKGSWQAPIRDVQTAMVLRMIPQPIEAPFRVLDVGAGFGALAGRYCAIVPMPRQHGWVLLKRC